MKLPLKITKTRILIAVATAIVLLIIISSFFGGNKVLATATVKKGDVVQQVSVTGKTKAASDLELAFEISGRVSRIGFRVGSPIRTGDALIQLDGGTLAAQVSQSQAALESQQAKLDALKRGSRPEDIQIKRTQLDKAQGDLKSAYQGISDALLDGFNKASDAFNNLTTPLFTQKYINYQTGNVSAKSYVESNHDSISSEITSWQTEVYPAVQGGNHDDIDAQIAKGQTHLKNLQIFLSRLSDTLDSGAAAGLSSSTLSSYKNGVALARTNVNAAIAALNGQDQALTAAKSGLKLAEDTLNLAVIGNTNEDIRAQEANVHQAEAVLEAAQAQYGKTIIRSPIDGIVTKVVPMVGEIVSPNSPAVTVMSTGKLEMEANIAEVDILSIKVGEDAKVKIDAFGSKKEFAAKVVAVDPAATMIEGVATYKATFQLADNYEEIRPGMTADITITSDKHTNVVIAPQGSVITKNGNKYVTLKNGDKTEEVQIKTGLRDQDGNTEVLEGLKEGDVVVIQK